MADVQSNIKVSIDTTEALASIKNLQRQISAFHTSMAKGGAAANAVTAQMQQGLINSINATGKFSAQMKTIRTTTESFTNSLEKNKFSLGEYFRYAGGASKTFGRLFKSEFDTINKVARENVKDLQTQYIKMGRDANGAMKAIAVRPLSLDMNDLATKTMIASERQALLNQLLKQGSTNLLNFGKNTQWAGRQLMVGFTIPLMTLGSAAAKTFMDMEAQAIRFKKVYGDLFTPASETQAALEGITELGKQFTKYGIAVSQTVGLAAEAAAAGFQGLDLQRQTTAATKLSILGQVDSQKALETTIALQNAFSMSSENLAESIDFLNAVENQTVLSLDDVSTAIPKAAPIVQQLGGDVKDLAFFMTAMKEGGINASEGANALKSGLASLINPTGKAAAMLEGFGINAKKIVVDNKGDLKKTVIEFATALNQLDPLNRAQAIEQMFGKFQFSRLSTLFANVTKEGTQAARVLDLAGSSVQELAALSEKELGMTSESAMNKFKGAVENLKLSLVPVGEEFLKAVTPIAEFVAKILDGFNNLGGGTKKAIVIITTAVAGLGPILLMTFGLLANGVANIIKGFTAMKTLFNKAGQSSATLGTEVRYMTAEQRNAAAVAASLDQVHRNLAQTFTAEAASVDALVRAYNRAIAAQRSFIPTGVPMGRGPVTKRAKGKPAVVGGTGNKDTELALLTPGETVIPKDMSKKYGALINGMIADNIPGYSKGLKSVSFNDQQFDIPVSSKTTQEALNLVFARFSKDIDGVTRVLRMLEAQARDTGQEFEILGAEKIKNILDVEGVARNKPKGTSATSYDGENYVFAHAKPQNEEITDPARIRALANATNSESLASDLNATANKGGKVQQLSSFGFMMPERANKKTEGGNFEMGRDEMADLFTGPNATRTLSPVYKAWAESNGLTLETVLKDPVLTKKMHTSVLGFGSLVSEEIKNLPEHFGEEKFYKAVDDAVKRIKKSDVKLTKAIKDMQSTSMLAVDNAKSGKALERRVINKKDAGLRQAVGLSPNFENYKSEGNKNFLVAGDKLAESAGKRDAKAYNKGVDSQSSPDNDMYTQNRSNQRSAHRQAIKDGTDDANGYQDAKERTIRKRERRRASSGGGTVGPDGQIIPPGTKLPGKRVRRGASSAGGTVGAGGVIIPTGMMMQSQPQQDLNNGQMLGPNRPTKYDKTVGTVAGKFRNVAGQVGTKVAGKGAALGMAGNSAMIAASFLPGKMGELAQKIMPAVFGFQALSMILKMLPGPFKLVTLGLAATVGIVKLVNAAKERERVAIEGLGDAATVSEKKLKTLGDFFGIVPKKIDFLSRDNAVKNTGANSQEQTAIDSLQENENFQKDFKKDIESLRKGTTEQAKLVFDSIAIQLRGSGFAKEQIDLIIKALQEESGKTDFKFDFANIDLSTDKGLLNFDKNFTAILKDIDAGISQIFISSARGTNGVITQYAEGAKQNIKLAADAATGFINGLRAQLENGTISAEQFAQGFGRLGSAIATMPKPEQVLVLDAVFKTLPDNVQKAAAGLTNAGQRMDILQAQALGLTGAALSLASAFKTLNSPQVWGPEGARVIYNAEQQVKAIKKQIADTAKAFQKAFSTGGNGVTNPYKDPDDGTGKGKDKLTAEEKYLEVLQKEIDALKEKRDAQKDANEEVQRQIDLQMKLQDLSNQAVQAKISGNYIQAAMLGQQSQNVQMEFNKETELRKKDAEIAALEARYRAIKDGAKLTTAETAKIPKTPKKVVKKANGGLIKGPGTGRSDSIKATLGYAGGGSIRVSDGEFVVKAASVRDYGLNAMNAVNNGTATISTDSGGTVYNVSMTVNGGNSNPQEIARLVMKEFENKVNKNNKSNKVNI
jgi:TP901 family phage tail tape measure protein